MKTYIDYSKHKRGFNSIELNGMFIPKDPLNRDYEKALKEIELGEAQLVDYVEPEPYTRPLNWTEVKIKREMLLKSSDWIAFPDVPHPKKQAWLDYRQALRDIPQNFSNAEDVVWPVQP